MGDSIFTSWAGNSGAVFNADIEELKGCRIGVDAEEYLAGLLVTQSREPLLPALGGLPFSLTLRVDEDLKRWSEAEISPIFVFNGLDLACTDRESILRSSLKATETLEEAWRIYDSGKGDESVHAFGKACTYRIYHILRSLMAHLHNKGIYVLTAPYTAAAQLVYMENDNVINAIYGTVSALVFGAEQVILEFDWHETRKFTFASIDKCTEALGATKEQFNDICLLSGCSILPALPELELESDRTKLESAKSLLQRSGNVVAMACAKYEDYLHQLYKARAAIKHSVTLKTNGEVTQDNFESVPSDTHEFIGQRLPNELYFYLSRGLAGPRVLNWRTRQDVLETPPLDGGLSPAYRDLVSKKLVPLRAQALIMITHLLNRYYQKRDVDLSTWWHDSSKQALNLPDATDSAKKADSWHVKSSGLPPRTATNGTPITYAITTLKSDAEAKKTVTPRPKHSGPQLTEQSELRPNVVWRFLEDRGYINKDHTLSSWGKALNAALQKATNSGVFTTPAVQREIEEAIFVALELLRFDCLNTKNTFSSPPYSGQPMRGTENDRQWVLLISRIGCLASLKHASIGYTGPLSRSTLAYQQMTAAVRGALRDLVEMHACNMFLSGAVERKTGCTQIYTDLSFDLPFVAEPDAALGLMVKNYLDELSNEAIGKPKVYDWFAHATDIDGDLAKVWKLFYAVNAGVQAGDEHVANGETKRMFRNAQEWLDGKLAAGRVPNGTGSGHD